LDFTFGLDAVRAKNVGGFSRFNNLDRDGETAQGTTGGFGQTGTDTVNRLVGEPVELVELFLEIIIIGFGLVTFVVYMIIPVKCIRDTHSQLGRITKDTVLGDTGSVLEKQNIDSVCSGGRSQTNLQLVFVLRVIDDNNLSRGDDTFTQSGRAGGCQGDTDGGSGRLNVESCRGGGGTSRSSSSSGGESDTDGGSGGSEVKTRGDGNRGGRNGRSARSGKGDTDGGSGGSEVKAGRGSRGLPGSDSRFGEKHGGSSDDSSSEVHF
jgi:hypothetical protein